MSHDAFPVTSRREWEGILSEPVESQRRRKLEAWLDRGHGECWLNRADLAAHVEEALRKNDGNTYQLQAWVVMPNHVHLVVDVWETPLSKLLHHWKGASARAVNLMLGRRGRFWDREYFDTLIRDQDHLKRAIRYTENNPVKAALATDRKTWQWGSARFRDEYERLPWQKNDSAVAPGTPHLCGSTKLTAKVARNSDATTARYIIRQSIHTMLPCLRRKTRTLHHARHRLQPATPQKRKHHYGSHRQNRPPPGGNSLSTQLPPSPRTLPHGQSIADHLATALGFRMAAILAVHGSSLDDSALGHLRALSLSCQAAVKLRCSDQNAARLQIETERWQRDREQRDDDRAQALQQRQRDALAAPIWAGFKKIERIRQFGPSAAVKFVFDILEEIETCKDPAHFESKVAAQMNQPGWLEKLAAEPPNPPPRSRP